MDRSCARETATLHAERGMPSVYFAAPGGVEKWVEYCINKQLLIQSLSPLAFRLPCAASPLFSLPASLFRSGVPTKSTAPWVASRPDPPANTALDAELPGGGWPAGGLIELLLPAPGCGELRLLAPTLAAASLLWIAPPFSPYAPALAGLGLMIERLTIVTPANAADAAWAAKQALRSGALSAVLWWQGETHTAAFPPPCAPCTWRPRRAARPCSRCGRTSCARNPRPHRCAWRSSRLLRRAWPSRCSSAVGRRWRRRSCSRCQARRCAARAGLCNRSRESPAMLWFALHLSELPLEAWRVATPARDALARPCCVVEARRVVLADAAAAAAGVTPGMSAATAASLLSGAVGLQVLARDPAREAAQVERLALALARFTPALVLQRDGVLLELSASLRRFGGARALWQAVRQCAQAAGVQALRMAAAPTATAAAVLARVEPPSPTRQRVLSARLDALLLVDVLAAWDIDSRLGDLLQGIGCRTLGDVRALPRIGLQRRGAAALLDTIARTYGEAPDPQPGSSHRRVSRWAWNCCTVPTMRRCSSLPPSAWCSRWRAGWCSRGWRRPASRSCCATKPACAMRNPILR